MIAASALHADCDTLWSEDMQDGMTLENRLRIVNPFRGAGEGGRGAYRYRFRRSRLAFGAINA
jgi:hypothetical protein